MNKNLFLGINSQEIYPLVKAFIFFFFVLASWYVLRPVRNEMALQSGISNLPWLLTTVMVVMVIANLLYSFMTSRIKISLIIPYCYGFFILNLFIFLFLWSVNDDNSRIWVGRAFYVWCQIYSFFIVSVFWVVIINFFRNEEAKRLFGIISAGGSLGAFFGSSIARYFSTNICGSSSISDWGPFLLIIFSAIFLLIAIFFSYQFNSSKEESEINDQIKIGGSFLDAFKNLINEPIIRYLGFYIILWTGLMTVAWMISLGIVENWSSDTCERTAFFARIEQWVTPLTLLVQLFLTSKVLRYIGLMPVLVFYGLIFIIIFLGYGLFPNITSVLVLTILIRVFEYGFNKPARETIYTALQKQDRYKSTVMLDTFIARSGDVLGGWFVKGLTVSGVLILSVTWAALPLAILISLTGYKISKAIKI
jgi:ATP:ADP antiporter, AAA family|tara:strand:+ start:744 stop:2006 length:1263 start_codon:yes stop_codon:yes gene_type:complete